MRLIAGILLGWAIVTPCVLLAEFVGGLYGEEAMIAAYALYLGLFLAIVVGVGRVL